MTHPACHTHSNSPAGQALPPRPQQLSWPPCTLSTTLPSGSCKVHSDRRKTARQRPESRSCRCRNGRHLTQTALSAALWTHQDLSTLQCPKDSSSRLPSREPPSQEIFLVSELLMAFFSFSLHNQNWVPGYISNCETLVILTPGIVQLSSRAWAALDARRRTGILSLSTKEQQ